MKFTLLRSGRFGEIFRWTVESTLDCEGQSTFRETVSIWFLHMMTNFEN